jgi:CRP/FNR family transcriptional regulator
MDAMVEDRFAETLDDRHRFAHEVLKHYGFYINSDPGQRIELLEVANPVEAGDGQVLLEAGYACRDVLLVGRGRIRIYIVGESGREVTLYYVHPGESCPVNLGAAIMDIGAYADASAVGGLAALTIPARDFREISQRNPALQDYVFSATVLRFGEVIALVRQITTRRVDHRLAEYLLRKFDESDESPPTAEVTQQNIALDLGTAREVISRRLQELDNVGAVQLRRGRIILQDRLALHRVIDHAGEAR